MLSGNRLKSPHPPLGKAHKRITSYADLYYGGDGPMKGS